MSSTLYCCTAEQLLSGLQISGNFLIHMANMKDVDSLARLVCQVSSNNFANIDNSRHVRISRGYHSKENKENRILRNKRAMGHCAGGHKQRVFCWTKVPFLGYQGTFPSWRSSCSFIIWGLGKPQIFQKGWSFANIERGKSVFGRKPFQDPTRNYMSLFYTLTSGIFFMRNSLFNFRRSAPGSLCISPTPLDAKAPLCC